jgi:2-hydroxychromene-2-carboxylate isomerase
VNGLSQNQIDNGTAARGDKGPIDFYFDFISPYGYLASLRIEELAARHGASVRWYPILLGVTVLKVMGLRPVMETPLKRDYVEAEVARYCRRHGMSLNRPLAAAPMNPLPVARMFSWLSRHAPAYAVPYAKQALHRYWQEGLAVDTRDALLAAAAAAGIDESVALRAIESPEAKSHLIQDVDAAVARGVFGSPFFLVGGEPFFGVDKLELIDEWLTCGGW